MREVTCDLENPKAHAENLAPAGLFLAHTRVSRRSHARSRLFNHGAMIHSKTGVCAPPTDCEDVES